MPYINAAPTAYRDEVIDLVREHALDDLATAGAEAEAIGAGADIGATAAVVALPATLVVASGALFEESLRRNPKWDHFWRDKGESLDKVWNGLFGGGGEPKATLADVHVRINANNVLRNQINSARDTRNLALVMGAHARVNRLAKVHNVAWSTTNAASQARDAQERAQRIAGDKAVVNHANQLYNRAAQYANATRAQAIAQARLDAQREIRDPLQRQITGLQAQIEQLQRSTAAHMEAVAKAVVAAALAPVAAHVATLAGQVSKIQTETTECTEPMCEVVGPKSDWGKLLKRFGPTAIWAMLAAIAASDPKAVEAAAEDVAMALGPVLSKWVEAFVGIVPGGTHAQPSEVSHELGSNPLSILGL